MFSVRYKQTENGLYTVLNLRPAPTEVEYPEKRTFNKRTTVDGSVVVQRPLRDGRDRKWIWKSYRPSILPYEDQWKTLEQLEYRSRVESGLWPLVEIWEDTTDEGGFERYESDGTTKLYTPVRFLQVTRKTRKGGGLVVYDESVIQFTLSDNTYTAF